MYRTQAKWEEGDDPPGPVLVSINQSHRLVGLLECARCLSSNARIEWPDFLNLQLAPRLRCILPILYVFGPSIITVTLEFPSQFVIIAGL